MWHVGMGEVHAQGGYEEGLLKRGRGNQRSGQRSTGFTELYITGARSVRPGSKGMFVCVARRIA